MRYIDLNKIDTNSSEFIQWKIKADRCFRELSSKVTHEERYEYFRNHGIWSELKPILIKIYGEKCWYSDCDLAGSFGDVDHFRPKNKSKNESGNLILPDGYWWLAYNYLNYRLSCEKCNRPCGNWGKSDYFPLKKGTSPATVGSQLDYPLLLDPCNKADVELIDCNDMGRIIALSSNPDDQYRVEISNKIYNWDMFMHGRKRIRNRCMLALEQFDSDYYIKDRSMISSLKSLYGYVNEEEPYSSFAKRYIREKITGRVYEKELTKALQLDVL